MKYFEYGNGHQRTNQKLAKRLINKYLPEADLDVHCYMHPVAAMMVSTKRGYKRIKEITNELPWLVDRADKRFIMLHCREENLKAYFFADGNVIAGALGVGPYTAKSSANWDEIEKRCTMSFTIPHATAKELLRA